MKASISILLSLFFLLLCSCTEDSDTTEQGPASRDRDKFLGTWESVTGSTPKEKVEFLIVNNMVVEDDSLAMQCIYSRDGEKDTLLTYLSDIVKLESPYAAWNGNFGDIEFEYYERENKELLAFGLQLEGNAELNCIFEKVE